MAIVSYLISTSDSHLQTRCHANAALHYSALSHGDPAPTTLHNESKNKRAFAANVTISDFACTPPFLHTHTPTQCCLTERLVWSDSNIILIATGDDSLSLLCWYPQAWQSFGHTCHRCTSANTRTISPPCLFWYCFVSAPSTYLFIYIGWHPAEFTSIQIFKYFSSENAAEFTVRVLSSQNLMLLSLGSRALLLFLQPTLFYSLLFILRTESDAFTAVLE